MAMYGIPQSFLAIVKHPNIMKYGVMASSVIGVRNVSTLELTKNISLISHENPSKIATLKLANAEPKPLVVMLTWLMARKKHVSKYADFYLKRGFDVMTISCSPWQLLWPVKGTQVVANDVLTFLDKNASYTPLLIHGFSIGGYLWAETMVQMAANRDRYNHIVNRIVGQIWDSLADVTEIPEGLPVAVFPRNKVLQSAFKQYIAYHLKTFDKVATCHYVRASQMFHTDPVRTPVLFFVSNADPIGAVSSNTRARENFDNMGIQTYWKIWEETPHVGHFRHYPEEYKDTLSKFMESIGLTTEEKVALAKMQAKL